MDFSKEAEPALCRAEPGSAAPPRESPLRSKQEQLRGYYQTLIGAWGCQHWWPARSRFEVIVGAYLTQNTAWTNVELALRQLRSRGVLSLKGIRETSVADLEKLIRSAGYFRQKAQRLKGFVDFLDERYGGSLATMFAQPTARLREELLALNGIGPETADSILLYAGQHAVFVVDAYTRRILERHGILPANVAYEEIRALCEDALGSGLTEGGAERMSQRRSVASGMQGRGLRGTSHTPSRMSMAKRTPVAQVYNDMHGLIVGVGKTYCLKAAPKCEECPLRKFLPISG